MRFRFGALLAALLASAAPAQNGEEIARLEAALQADDQNQSAILLDELGRQRRPKDGRPRVDPLLYGLQGRLALARGAPVLAIELLRHADADEVPPAQRAAARLALLLAQERVGDRSGAAATLARLKSEPIPAADRPAVALAELRLQLVDRPLAALAGAQGIAAGLSARDRWEADLIEAQALALTGSVAAAQTAADRAWAGSAQAPAARLAPLRVGLQRAGIAAQRGDRDALIAMLNAVGGSISEIDKNLADGLPECDGAIGPDDWVTFAAYTGTTREQILVPLAASRPGAVVPLYDALAGRTLLSTVSPAPSGTIFTARCRAWLASDWRPVDRRADPGTRWLIERGLLEPAAHDTSLDSINALSAEIEALNGQHPGSPLLIPLQLEMSWRLTVRAMAENDVQEWQVVQARNDAFQAMRKLGAGVGVVPPVWLDDSLKAIGAAGSPEEQQRLSRIQAFRLLAELPDELAYVFTTDWLARDVDLPGESRLRITEILLGRDADRGGDPRRAALLTRKGQLLRNAGDQAGARAAFRTAGVPEDLCSTYDAEPKLASMDINDEDYPVTAMNSAIAGVSVLESDVAADGKVARHRLILSAPSLLFDQTIAREVKAFQLELPRRNGKVRACRGLLQRIVWKLPDAPDEWQAPSFLEPPEQGS
jgi:hypothetical protein